MFESRRPVRVDSGGILGPCVIRPGGRRCGGPWNTVAGSLEMLRDALPLLVFPTSGSPVRRSSVA